jgi:ATP-dependent Clp protease ATP-binding subunit ClpA
MFERFTKRSRAAVERGLELARASGSDEVRADHLLLAVIDDEDALAVRVLGDLGVPVARVREAVERRQAGSRRHGFEEGDAEALQTIGIDLDQVLHHVDENLGDDLSGAVGAMRSGRLRFAKESKKVLELALREALRLGHNYIGTEHILLGLLRIEGGAVPEAFAELGLRHRAVSTAIVDALRRAG